MRVHLLLLAALFVSCTESEEKLKEGDKPKLVRMVELDQRVAKAMSEADDLARKGEVKSALDRIETKVKPDIAENDRLCATSEMSSAWGRTTKNEVCAIVRSRKSELPRYEAAVKGDDKSKLAEALLAQAEIEKRAVAMVAAFEQR